MLLCFWFGGSIAMACQIRIMRGIIDYTLPEAVIAALCWPFYLFVISRQRNGLVQRHNEFMADRGYHELEVGLPPPERCDPCEKAIENWNLAFPAIVDCAECRKRFEQWKAEYGVQIDGDFDG